MATVSEPREERPVISESMAERASHEFQVRRREQPRVFVVQRHMRRVAGSFIDAYDLSPARQFGELVYLFQQEDGSLSPDEILERLVDELDDMQPTDWLLLVGSPLMIGLAFVIASDVCGSFGVLQWDRVSGCYVPVKIPAA